MRVALLTRRLVAGGAERQILLLAEGLADRGHACTLITFRGEPGDPRPEGVRVIDLARGGLWDVFGFVHRLRAAIRASDAEFLYSFLPVANVLALLMGRLSPRLRVILGLRASDMELRRYGIALRFAAWCEARFARRASAVIANSAAGYRHALSRGLPASLTTVVRNGIDLNHFRRREGNLRDEFGLSPDALIVGLVARADPMKDRDSFARALALLRDRQPDAIAFVAGDVSDAERAHLEGLAGGMRICWAGWRDDMPAVYSTLDVLCLCSVWGEGTSNAIAEAMACGVPCVVTDVGDNAELVGDTGLVVPPADPQLLADALGQLAALDPAERGALGERARERISGLCGLNAMIDHTVEILRRARETDARMAT
jgi:glycosyltransferase involved in cell wall biosynthesis